MYSSLLAGDTTSLATMLTFTLNWHEAQNESTDDESTLLVKWLESDPEHTESEHTISSCLKPPRGSLQVQTGPKNPTQTPGVRTRS